MRRIIPFLLVVLFVFSLKVQAQTTSYYVNAATGLDTNTGTTAQTAWATLNPSKWSTIGDCKIYIADGQYLINQKIYITVNAELIGTGMNLVSLMGASDVNFSNNATMTSGMFDIAGTKTLKIEGLTLKNVRREVGTYTLGGAITAQTQSNLILRDMNMRNCIVLNGGGGAIDAKGSVDFETVTFENCTATAQGGVLSLAGNAVCRLEKVQVLNNNTSSNVIAVDSPTADITINNCFFKGNSTTGYGAVLGLSSTSGNLKTKISNSTFVDNQGYYCGVIFIGVNPDNARTIDFSVTNCIFTNNTISAGAHGTVYQMNGGAASTLTGTIAFVNNTMFHNGKSDGVAGAASCIFFQDMAVNFIYANNICLQKVDKGESLVFFSSGLCTPTIKGNITDIVGGGVHLLTTLVVSSENKIVGQTTPYIDGNVAVKLNPTLIYPMDGNPPYMELGVGSVAIDAGYSTITTASGNIVPQTDVRGTGISNNLKDAGAYESPFSEIYPDLRQILNTQINNAVIDIPHGTYLLDLKSSGAYQFINKSNVLIRGNGSTIICNRQSQAFDFNNCQNFEVDDLFIEYDPPCSTQGTITAMSADKRTWDVEIHDGYPIDNLGGGRIQAYGQSTLELVKNFGTASSDNILKTGPRSVRFTINGWENNLVQLGDYVALDVLAIGGIQGHTIISTNCKNMKFSYVVVYDSNCFSFFEQDCESTMYWRCVVTRKPYNPKYTIQPLRAGIADGIHSKFAKTGPNIQESRIEYNGDDCIAINGQFYPIYKVDKRNKYIYYLTTSSNINDTKVIVGDSIVCVNNNGSIRGKSKSTAISMASPVPTPAEINTCFSMLSQVVNSSSYLYGVRVKVSTWPVGLAIGDVLYSNDRVGSRFIVKNNQVGHNRSRAILIKASNGIIDGNTIVGSAMSGIAVAPEFDWMEAGCSSNVNISNNVITNCMFESSMWGSLQAGAIAVVSKNPAGSVSPAGSLNNISINNNFIEGCPQPCVVVTSTNGLKYYNNTITPDLSMIRNHGYNFGVQNNVDFWMTNVSNYTNNTSFNVIVKAPFISDTKDINSDPASIILIDKNANVSLFDNQNGEISQITIRDFSGKIILYQKVLDSKSISLASLKKGIYLASIKYNQRLITKKIIIQ